jgi:hypothetical protein
MHRANDTFVVELNGTPRRINKGDMLVDTDEVVQHDQAGGGLLFTKMNYDEPEPAKPSRGRRPA